MKRKTTSAVIGSFCITIGLCFGYHTCNAQQNNSSDIIKPEYTYTSDGNIKLNPDGTPSIIDHSATDKPTSQFEDAQVSKYFLTEFNVDLFSKYPDYPRFNAKAADLAAESLRYKNAVNVWGQAHPNFWTEVRATAVNH
jgi:hypothetical protein